MRPFSMLAALAPAFLVAACDPFDDGEASWGHTDDDVEFREVYPCDEYKAKIPQTTDAMLAMFRKVGVITNNAVVRDPCRTSMDSNVWLLNKCPVSTQGVWTFWHLMSQMAGTNDTTGFILTMLESMEETPLVNGVPLQARGKVRALVIDPWRKASNCTEGKKWADDKTCKLDPKKAPFALTAIVNRIDLRPDTVNLNQGGYIQPPDSKDTAGEGRFVFQFTHQDGTPLEGGIILEYALPTKLQNRVTWANDWLSLNNYAAFDASYVARLQQITDKFTKKGVFPGRPNFGNAINAVRTNERAFDPKPPLSSQWTLRAFKLACPGICALDGRNLLPQIVDQTPQNLYQNDEKRLLPFLNNNAAAIRAGTHVVPEDIEGEAFIAGESLSQPLFNTPFIWAFDLMINEQFQDKLNAPDTRRLFAIGTCNGCHYKETENTSNMHIRLPAKGADVQVSDFLSKAPLTLSTIFDKSDNQVQFNEPKRRLCELFHTQSGLGNVLTTAFGSPH